MLRGFIMGLGLSSCPLECKPKGLFRRLVLFFMGFRGRQNKNFPKVHEDLHRHIDAKSGRFGANKSSEQNSTGP